MAQDLVITNNYNVDIPELAASQSKSSIHSPKSDFCEIETCESVKHILNALKFYEGIQRDDKIKNDEDILEYFNEHGEIVNDYHHVILQHLSTGNKTTDNNNFNIIDKIFRKSIKCDITKCMNYKRNHRNRAEEEISGITGLSFEDTEYAQEKLMNETFKLEHEGDPIAIFYKQFLDSIHCYFIHAVDVGFRIQIDDDELKDNNEDDEGLHDEKVDLDSTTMYEDRQIEQIKAKMDSQRKQIKSLGRVQFNKFNTEIS